MTKRLLCMLLAIVMIVSVLPINVLAVPNPPAETKKIEKIENFVIRDGDKISLDLPEGDYLIVYGAGEFSEEYIRENTEYVEAFIGKDILDLSTLSSDELKYYTGNTFQAVIAEDDDDIMSAEQINARFKDQNLADLVDVDNGENGYLFFFCKIDKNNSREMGNGDKAYAVTGIGLTVEPYGAASEPEPAKPKITLDSYTAKNGKINVDMDSDTSFDVYYTITNPNGEAMTYDVWWRVAKGNNARATGKVENVLVPANGSYSGKLTVTIPARTDVSDCNQLRLHVKNTGSKHNSADLTYTTTYIDDVLVDGCYVTLHNNGGLYNGKEGDPKFFVDADRHYGSLAWPKVDGSQYSRTGYTMLGYARTPNAAAPEYTIDGLKQIKWATSDQIKDWYAIWERNDFTVTFNANGGTVDTANKTVTYELPYGDLPVPTREGWTFLGWKLGKETITETTIVNTADDHTLTAEWTPNTTAVTPAAAAYKVEYYFEQDGKYVLDEEATKFPVYGALGAEITAAQHMLDKKGYHLNDTLSTPIVVAMPYDEDGELVVKTLKLYYDLNQYNIAVDKNEGGTVTVQSTALFNEVVSLNITPDTGYKVASAKLKYQGDKGGVTTNLMGFENFAMPTANVTVVVEFEKIIYDIAVEKNEGGTVVVQDTAVYGETVPLTITPDAGYKVVSAKLKYQGDKGGVTTNLMGFENFAMPTANVTVVVKFEKIIYDITVDANEGGTVVVQDTAVYGETVPLTITPDAGYKVVSAKLKYQGDKGGVTTNLMGFENFAMPTANATVVVKFEKIIYDINVEKNEGGTVVVQDTAVYGETVPLTITPDTGYRVISAKLKYQGDKGGVTANLMGFENFAMPTADVTVVVKFEKNIYNIAVDATEGGTVEVQKNAVYGETVPLTITPDTGYRVISAKLVDKNGDVIEDLMGSEKFEMPAADNVTVVVEFEKIVYNITVAEYDGVTVVVPESAKYNEEVAYTITAKEGFELVSAKMVCGDEKTTLGASGTFKMPAGDVEIVVEFVRLTTPIEPIKPVIPVKPVKPNCGSMIKDILDKLFEHIDSPCKPTEPEATEPEETVPTTPTEPEETVPSAPVKPVKPIKPIWTKWLYRILTWWN